MFETLLSSGTIKGVSNGEVIPGALIPADYSAGGIITVGNEIYFIGGYSKNANLNLFVKYNTVNNTWTKLTNLAKPTRLMVVSSVGTKIYVHGGYDTAYDYTFRSYDTITGIWTTLAASAAPIQSPAVCTMGNYIYIFGGISNNKLYRYDITGGTWTTLADSPKELYSAAMVATQEKLYVLGGLTKGSVNQTGLVYDPNTNTWATIASQTNQIKNPQSLAFLIEDKIWYTTVSSRNIDIYDPVTNTWVYDSITLPQVMYGGVVSGNKIWLAGSATPNRNLIKYDPRFGSTSPNYVLIPSVEFTAVTDLLAVHGITLGTTNFVQTDFMLFNDKNLNKIFIIPQKYIRQAISLQDLLNNGAHIAKNFVINGTTYSIRLMSNIEWDTYMTTVVQPPIDGKTPAALYLYPALGLSTAKSAWVNNYSGQLGFRRGTSNNIQASFETNITSNFDSAVYRPIIEYVSGPIPWLNMN